MMPILVLCRTPNAKSRWSLSRLGLGVAFRLGAFVIGLRRHTLWSLLLTLLLGGALLWSAGSEASAQSASDLKPLSIQVGFTKYAFSNVNKNDAEAAFKVFVQAVARKRGYAITATTHVFEDASDFEPEIQAGRISLVIIDSWRFLAMNIHRIVTPYFVTAERDNPGKRYVLLTRRGGGLEKLQDLRGKELLEVEVTNANLGRSWLETLLRTSGLGTHETFFGRVEKANKTSATVLPVFFGQKPACLVDESGFNVMKELNPQVGTTLQAMLTSEPFVDGMICLRNEGWPSEKQKQDMINAIAELHTDPAGQQILTLFKIGQLMPFQPAQLDSVRQLRAQHDRWKPSSELQAKK